VIGELTVDTSRIQAILTFNSFSSDPHFVEFATGSLENSKDSDRECGIWIFPSFFNHSCVPNCKRVLYSDLMMIYASMYFIIEI
jgi:SET domain-containing protein